jgi:hypothetical protein
LENDGLDWRRWAALQLADNLGKGVNTDKVPATHAKLLERMEKIAAAAPPLNVKALALDGNAIMRLANRPQGPWIGSLQKYLMEAVLDGPELNTAHDLELMVREWAETNP